MLDVRDLDRIRRTGRDPDAVRAQVERLRRGPRAMRLTRPCTLGDGIRRLDRPERFDAPFREAVAGGRVMGFVPASGAATRMLADLDDPDDAAVTRARELALWESLGVDEAAPAAIARAIRERFDAVPKGLVPFHRTPEGTRTAFEEHLVEAARLLADGSGRVRLHFTIGAEHEGEFQRALRGAAKRMEPALRVRFDVTFSFQDAGTDTVAVEADGAPVRDGEGLLFRPGGHGALLRNLQRCGGDVVLVKNIDNVVPDRLRPLVVEWRARLGGLLVDLQSRAHALLRRLEAGDVTAGGDAARFLADELGAEGLTADRAAVWERLYRPIRVCGMVRNDGQPGGGPFWVEGWREPQIVESAQVDHDDAAQEAAWRSATHFNPVDLALGLRDHHGAAFDLSRYVDLDASIVTRKPHEGRTITVLEHPGLWNGSMAGWNTVFVEIPPEVFQPVKRLSDLLGEGHRA